MKAGGFIHEMSLRSIMVGALSVSLIAGGFSFWSFQSTPRFIQVASVAPSSQFVPLVEQRPSPALLTPIPMDTRSLEVPDHSERSLLLKLIGVLMAGENGENATAVIQDLRNGVADVYKIGSQLPGRATVVEIHPAQVTVERANGTRAILYLERSLQMAKAKFDKVVTPISETERVVDQSQLQKHKVPIMIELAQVDVQPKISDGRLLGFSIRETDPDGILQALGVDEGDVISEINGEATRNYRDAARLLGQAMHTSSFNVTLIKGRKRSVLTYHMD